MTSPARAMATGREAVKCTLCTSKLDQAEGDDFERRLCSSCQDRPEARRLAQVVRHPAQRGQQAALSAHGARAFTPAEKALIRKVHGYMPAQQLLDVLNERLMCDLGPDAASYTMEQLHAEIGSVAAAMPEGGHDWASLRKLLNSARCAGTLDAIDEQVINDFAVVFSLNHKQLVVLKDIVLQAKED